MVVRDAEADAAAAMLMRAGEDLPELDFSHVPGRRKAKLPDGNVYEILGLSDFTPGWFVKAKPHLLVVRSIPDGLPNANSEALGLDKAIRALAKLVMPDVPAEVMDDLPYLVATQVVASCQAALASLEIAE